MSTSTPNQAMAPNRSGVRLFVAAVVAVTLSGCRCNPEFAEVQGVVTLDGKPLEEVEIVFMPDPESGTKGPNSSCYTDKQGHFKLRCGRANRDGAIVGFHRVCVIDIAAVTTPSNLPGMTNGAKGGKNAKTSKGKTARVPPIYNNPAKTPLRAAVKADKQTLDFNIRTERIK